VVRGTLSDSCDNPQTIIQRSGVALFVDVYRELDPAATCAMQETPFEHRFALPQLLEVDENMLPVSALIVNDYWLRVDMPTGVEPSSDFVPYTLQITKANVKVNEISLERTEANTQTVTLRGEMPCGYLIARAYPSWTEMGVYSVDAYIGVDPALSCMAGNMPFEVVLPTEADPSQMFMVNGFMVVTDPAISTATQDFIINDLAVDNYDVLILESFPPQISVSVQGFRDGCEFPIVVVPTVYGGVLEVRVGRVAPAMTACTMQAVPFEATGTFMLSADFESGTYPVYINGERRDDVQL
jgi:hypothetical protein